MNSKAISRIIIQNRCNKTRQLKSSIPNYIIYHYDDQTNRCIYNDINTNNISDNKSKENNCIAKDNFFFSILPQLSHHKKGNKRIKIKDKSSLFMLKQLRDNFTYNEIQENDNHNEYNKVPNKPEEELNSNSNNNKNSSTLNESIEERVIKPKELSRNKTQIDFGVRPSQMTNRVIKSIIMNNTATSLNLIKDISDLKRINDNKIILHPPSLVKDIKSLKKSNSTNSFNVSNAISQNNKNKSQFIKSNRNSTSSVNKRLDNTSVFQQNREFIKGYVLSRLIKKKREENNRLDIAISSRILKGMNMNQMKQRMVQPINVTNPLSNIYNKQLSHNSNQNSISKDKESKSYWGRNKAPSNIPYKFISNRSIKNILLENIPI